MYNLKNKVIVVTGGSGLLGQAIIKRISEENGFAINLDIVNSSNLANHFFDCDILEIVSIKNVINEILNKYGKIDGWVNNAYPRTNDWGNKFEDVELNSWNVNLEMQLSTVFMCCQEVLKVMKEQGFGTIVNMASIYGIVGPDFSVYNETKLTMPAAYSAIKGGVINFSRYLASYYGSYNIRINCVSPGGIFDNQDPLFVSNYEKKVPLRRMGLPVDISPAVTFLLSDESSYITGQNIVIDGGWTAI